jgi:hypothetical protein
VEKWKSDHALFLKREVEGGVKSVDYIDPITNYNNVISKKEKQSLKPTSANSSKIRAARKDTQKNVKFPISPVMQIKLRSYCKQAGRIFVQQGKEPITQTKFNTALLRYGLNNPDIIQWDFEYQDTKTYMHTQLLKVEYENEIGGPYGLAVRKSLSDRKVVYQVIHSVLNWLERSGALEKIL